MGPSNLGKLPQVLWVTASYRQDMQETFHEEHLLLLLVSPAVEGKALLPSCLLPLTSPVVR